MNRRQMERLKILMTEFVTHDVKRFIVEKPKDFKFKPGQAAYVAINKGTWRWEERPFTFTSLNNDLVLEFTIKRYKEPKGVTDKLHQMVPGDEILIKDVFGTIEYKGRGVFIAGGAGITPFIAILRQLKKDNKIEGNKLIFSNKEEKDIILEKELKEMFDKKDLILTLTNETIKKEGYFYEKIDKEFLKKHIQDFSQYFYICGPKPLVKDIKGYLKELGAKTEKIVFEDVVN